MRIEKKRPKCKLKPMDQKVVKKALKGTKENLKG